MALDPSIPLQVQTPNTFGTLASVLGVKNQQMANQQAAIDLKERQGVQGVLANIKNYQDANGNVDMTKLTPDIMAVAPTTGSAVLSNVAQAQSAATAAKQSWSNLSDSTRQRFGKVMTSLVGQKPDVIASTFQSLSSQPEFQAGLPAIQHFWSAAVQPALQTGNQGEIDNAMYRVGKMGESATTQQSMNAPEGVTVNDGRSTKVVSTKPGTAVAPGQTVPGTAATLQPGPTTQTVDQSGTQGIVGTPQADFSGVQGPARAAILADIAARAPGSDNAREAVNVLSGRPQGFIPQSLPAGQAQNIANNVDEMNRHFASLQDQSSGAQLQEGLIGNIKSLAAGAATGTGAGRKAFISGLLAALHIPGTGDEAKDTDLLEKNMAQLNLSTPASTDAARTIVSAARPHGTMQEGAIREAADQLQGQIQANVAMRNMLAPAKLMGDVQTYNAQRQKLESIADPRAWQYVNLGPGSAQAKAFMSKLQPDDRAALIQKVEQLEQLGMLK